jgi:fluoride exporter
VERFLIVCGAGGLGCGARYLVSLWSARRLGTTFPYGTLIVNVVGSLAIMFVMELSVRTADFSPNLRLALTTGFLGGFTTYSAFDFESTTLLLDGQALRGVLNLAVTLAGCFAAGLLGLWLARKLTG